MTTNLIDMNDKKKTSIYNKIITPIFFLFLSIGQPYANFFFVYGLLIKKG